MIVIPIEKRGTSGPNLTTVPDTSAPGIIGSGVSPPWHIAEYQDFVATSAVQTARLFSIRDSVSGDLKVLVNAVEC